MHSPRNPYLTPNEDQTIIPNILFEITCVAMNVILEATVTEKPRQKLFNNRLRPLSIKSRNILNGQDSCVKQCGS